MARRLIIPVMLRLRGSAGCGVLVAVTFVVASTSMHGLSVVDRWQRSRMGIKYRFERRQKVCACTAWAVLRAGYLPEGFFGSLGLTAPLDYSGNIYSDRCLRAAALCMYMCAR